MFLFKKRNQKQLSEKPIIHQVLVMLLERNAINEDQIIINDFLRKFWRIDTNEADNDLDRIKRALERMSIKGYITKSTDPPHHQLNEVKINQQGQKYQCTLNKTNIQVGLTPNGYTYITDVLRTEKQDEINESLKENSDAQIITAKLVASFTFLTLIISILSFINTCNKPQQNILQESPHAKYHKTTDSLKQKPIH